MFSIKGHKLHIDLNFAVPLPHKYRGGGVAVFRNINNQPEVLLGLRANNPGRGLWSFPGGGAEGTERLSTAAIREFKEETGVQLFGRYITRTGIFQIKNIFFEWNTLIIESTQNINFSRSLDEYGREFISMKWIPISELESMKLHQWVKDAIAVYLSGDMKPYAAKPTKKEIKSLTVPKKQNRAKTTHRVSGESLLFDMAEMVLTKVDPDGTKYFKPAYEVKNKRSAIQEAFYGI